MSSLLRLPFEPHGLSAAVAALVREARVAIGWTQDELADRVGTSQTKIWRIERGDPGALDVPTIERVLGALGLRPTLEIEGRHLADRRAQRDAVHARMIAAIAGRLRRWGWDVRTEVPIGVDPPRGWIDLMAHRSADRAVTTIEVKSDIPDAGGLLRQVSWYERETPMVARSLGWQPERVAIAVVCLDSARVAARIAENRQILKSAFPADPRDVDAWLRDPGRPMPAGWSIGVTDLAARRGPALRLSALDGRAHRPVYRDYADAASRVPVAVHRRSRRSQRAPRP